MPRLAASASAVGDAALARVARRHEHAGDLLGPERVDRDRRDERRVDPAGEPEEHVREAVLHHVVAGAEHQRRVHLVHRLEQWLDPRRLRRRSRDDPRSPRPRGADRPRPADRESARRWTALRTSRSTISRSSSNWCARATSSTRLVEHHRRAVEDELVLAADEVHVDDRRLRLRRARREHRLAFLDPARVVRRRVDVHDELRAPVGLGDDRSGRTPRVLAHRERDPQTGDDEQRAVDGGRLEVALLVEHRRSSGADACGRCPAPHRVRTARPSWRALDQVGSGNPITAAVLPVLAANLVQHLGGLGDERRRQQQVLGRVAGDRQLRERNEVAVDGWRRGRRRRGCAPRCRSRSPTTRLSCAAATRIRGIGSGYEASLTTPDGCVSGTGSRGQPTLRPAPEATGPGSLVHSMESLHGSQGVRRRRRHDQVRKARRQGLGLPGHGQGSGDQRAHRRRHRVRRDRAGRGRLLLRRLHRRPARAVRDRRERCPRRQREQQLRDGFERAVPRQALHRGWPRRLHAGARVREDGEGFARHQVHGPRHADAAHVRGHERQAWLHPGAARAADVRQRRS